MDDAKSILRSLEYTLKDGKRNWYFDSFLKKIHVLLPNLDDSPLVSLFSPLRFWPMPPTIWISPTFSFSLLRLSSLFLSLLFRFRQWFKKQSQRWDLGAMKSQIVKSPFRRSTVRHVPLELGVLFYVAFNQEIPFFVR